MDSVPHLAFGSSAWASSSDLSGSRYPTIMISRRMMFANWSQTSGFNRLFTCLLLQSASLKILRLENSRAQKCALTSASWSGFCTWLSSTCISGERSYFSGTTKAHNRLVSRRSSHGSCSRFYIFSASQFQTSSSYSRAAAFATKCSFIFQLMTNVRIKMIAKCTNSLARSKTIWKLRIRY